MRKSCENNLNNRLNAKTGVKGSLPTLNLQPVAIHEFKIKMSNMIAAKQFNSAVTWVNMVKIAFLQKGMGP